ncbi:unnamed protein product [Chilo suppressalis]|uniref:Actin-related protein 2/3 complex subunit 5 n=1 Tax=Chilo suppressalis TaxID=168631 RepID=A0ABN8B5Z6_CHISP|nr:unnamed protein product [Chilo suppressalis]
MAKNTSSSAFRKIDIDQYNEDNFKDDEAEQAVPTGPDEGEDNALALTLKVLLAIKSAQIEEVVGNLSRDDVDVLMKYIYRGFEYPSEGSSGHLLLWHEKAYNIGGTGSIVRVLSDRMKKSIFLLLCIYFAAASHHHSHIIPIDGYETELQDLGQHVEIPETPVKVIKITKTIAVKVPVPYPVKVREKVPYPVQVAKPYPVPVPQIIKVPHIVTPTKSGHSNEGTYGGNNQFNTHRLGVEGNSYQVQEPQDGHAFGQEGQSFTGGNSNYGQNFGDDISYEGAPGSSYDPPASSYEGYSAPQDSAAHEPEESQSYDQALQDYFSKQKSSGNQDGSSYY